VAAQRQAQAHAGGDAAQLASEASAKEAENKVAAAAVRAEEACAAKQVKEEAEALQRAATLVALALKEPRNCAGSHGLRPYNAPNDSMTCGGCQQTMQKSDPFRGCKACSEYYCAACAATPFAEKERKASSFLGVSSDMPADSTCSGKHGKRM
jgi:hypothetical protein